MYLLGSLTASACAAAARPTLHQAVVMTDDSLRITIATDRPRYAVGQPIELTLSVANESAAVIVLEFSSGQRFDFLIHDARGETMWQWSQGKGFIQVLGQVRLEPGEILSYAARFEGLLEPGAYSAVGELASSNRPLEAAASFVVD